MTIKKGPAIISTKKRKERKEKKKEGKERENKRKIKEMCIVRRKTLGTPRGQRITTERENIYLGIRRWWSVLVNLRFKGSNSGKQKFQSRLDGIPAIRNLEFLRNLAIWESG